MLSFGEKCLTALQRCVILRTFDGDARNVGELLDKALFE